MDKDNNNWAIEMYRQGSEACRNYSRLTMQTRTLSQQVLVLGVVGIGAAVAAATREHLPFSEGYILGGSALVLFSLSLGIVDWHYQTAFMAIRDALVMIEANAQNKGLWDACTKGPWEAHLEARSRKRDHLASYVPFFLLFSMGLFLLSKGLRETYAGYHWNSAALIVWSFAAFLVALMVRAGKNRSTETGDKMKKKKEIG